MSSPSIPDLTSMDSTPVAGPSQMTRAHRNGMRKAVARVKSWMNPAVHPAEQVLKTALVIYLEEWDKVYGEGVQVLGLSRTERTVMIIRQDTVQQMLKELGSGG